MEPSRGTKKNRSEGARHRNGLFHSCTCGRVAGVVWLLGSGGRLGFVVLLLSLTLRGSGVFRGTFRETGRSGMCSPKPDLQNVPSERGGPRVAHWSSLRGRVCVWRGGAVLLGGGWTGVVCRVVVSCRVVLSAGLVPCGAVFFEGRFWGRGIAGRVLLSKIYVLACSETGRAPSRPAHLGPCTAGTRDLAPHC